MAGFSVYKKPQKPGGFWGFACLWIFLKRFSVFCRRVSILLFEIPDELGCIGIADGITDFIELLIRGLEQFLCLLQLKITKDPGKGRASFTPETACTDRVRCSQSGGQAPGA